MIKNELPLYNQYNGLDEMCNRVIDFLVFENEDIWKLLKYNEPNALFLPELTIQEKSDLIYDAQEDFSGFRVFREPFLDDAFEERCAQLRVYITSISPDRATYGTVDIAVEIISHVKNVSLVGRKNRMESLLMNVFKALNGKYVDGVGQLVFDRNASFYDLVKLNLYNNRNFAGYTLIMSTKIGDLDVSQ